MNTLLHTPAVKVLFDELEKNVQSYSVNLPGKLNDVLWDNGIVYTSREMQDVLKVTAESYHLDARQIQEETNHIQSSMMLDAHFTVSDKVHFNLTEDKVGNSGLKMYLQLIQRLETGKIERLSELLHSGISPSYVQNKLHTSGQQPKSMTVYDRYILSAMDMDMAAQLTAKDVIQPTPDSDLSKQELQDHLEKQKENYLHTASMIHPLFTELAQNAAIEILGIQQPNF